MSDYECPECGVVVGFNVGNCGGPGSAKCRTLQITQRDDKIARLQAIVDGLDKTADGVPIVCPMTVWFVSGGHIEEWALTGYQNRGGLLVVYAEDGMSALWDWDECYSTLELAEAARATPDA